MLAISAADPQGFSGAVGAFVVAGGLTILAGFWRPLMRLALAVPAAITHAMLAGILLPICLAPFKALGEAPLVAGTILLTWFAVSRISRLFAVPVAVLITVALVIWYNGRLPLPEQLLTTPVWVMPAVTWQGALGLALPLFLVTMATQNMPGVAVLKANGYTPAPGRMFVSVGVISVLSALFGAIQTNLAAITAAMCSGEDAHPDPSQRYWAAVWGGVFYALFGIFAALVTYVAAAAPPLAMASLAGVALFGVFVGSASSALEQPETREAAALTFVITASGLTLFGIGGAVWGLLAGGLVHLFQTWRLRRA